MQRIFAFLAVGLLLAGLQPAHAQDTTAPAPAKAAENASTAFRSKEIVFAGKLYSPVKLSVFLPYTAEILTIKGQTGQQVKRDDVLAVYELPIEARMEEKTRLSTAAIKDLEYKLALAEKEIDRLTSKSRELEAMSQRNMTSQQARLMNAKELEVYRREKSSIQEQLALNRDLLSDRVALAVERFGKGAGVGRVPKEGIIKAPTDGYVLWMNPDLRVGAKLPKGAELYKVGKLNPMIIRAQVHEIEALKLRVGMTGEVTFDSLPGKKFTATVSRIPWAPIPAALQQPSYYDIELAIPNPTLELKEGLKGQITITP